MEVELKLTRIYQPDCTVGVINHKSGFRCMTLELPWLNNTKGKSCIPSGTYECFKRVSNKNGHVFELKNVTSRTYIQCHAANHTRQLEGCIAVGSSLTDFDNDNIIDVSNSKKTHDKLMSLLPDTFLMVIE